MSEDPEEIRGAIRALAILKREYLDIDTNTRIDMILATTNSLKINRYRWDVGPHIADIVTQVGSAYASSGR